MTKKKEYNWDLVFQIYLNCKRGIPQETKDTFSPTWTRRKDREMFKYD